LFAVSSLDVVIPLHLFVLKHNTTCNTGDKNCCSQEQGSCPICDFDLFIGFPQEVSFSLKRIDVFLNEMVCFTAQSVIINSKFNLADRAPPASLKG
jgi:hypothetical protein